MQLRIPEPLRAKLVALRAEQLQHPYPDEVLVGREVVVLTLGMGPAIYLGLDGRVVIWHYMEDEPPRITEDLKDIAGGLVIGAKNNDLPELLDLLPKRPAGGVVCRLCSGRRWVEFGTRLDGKTPEWLVCWECNGLGWQTA
jgi:hypothetical protein